MNKLYDEEIEKACLSSGILSQHALLELIDKIGIEDFYYDNHRIIYQCLLELNQNKINVDLISLRDKLNQKNLYEEIGGTETLIDIFQKVASSANVRLYIERLIEYSQRRQVQKIYTKTMDQVNDKEIKVSDIILDLESNIKTVDRERGKSIYPVNVILGDNIANLQIKPEDYIETGVTQLDKLIYGFFNELIILAARPSMGKTSLALNIARNISEEKKVLFFSLEQSAKDLSIRLLSSETKIPFNRIKISGLLNMFEFEAVEKAHAKLKKLDLHINDQILKAPNILNATKRHSDYKKPSLGIIDYLQLIPSQDRKIQRYIQIGDITRALKGFTKDFGFPILVLCQLSRAGENRQNKKPILSDLRESGDIEQDADKVIFIHRENIDLPETELVIAKNRNGPCGVVNVEFEKKYMQFN